MAVSAVTEQLIPPRSGHVQAASALPPEPSGLCDGVCCTPLRALFGLAAGLAAGLPAAVAETSLQFTRLVCIFGFLPFVIGRTLFLAFVVVAAAAIGAAQHTGIAMFYLVQVAGLVMVCAAVCLLAGMIGLPFALFRVVVNLSWVLATLWVFAGVAGVFLVLAVAFADFVPCLFLAGVTAFLACFVGIADKVPCGFLAVVVVFIAIFLDILRPCLGICGINPGELELYRKAGQIAKSRVSSMCMEEDPARELCETTGKLCCNRVSAMCCETSPVEGLCEGLQVCFRQVAVHCLLGCGKVCNPSELNDAAFEETWEGHWVTGRAVSAVWMMAQRAANHLVQHVILRWCNRLAGVAEAWTSVHGQLSKAQCGDGEREIGQDPPGCCAKASAATSSCGGHWAVRMLAASTGLFMLFWVLIGMKLPQRFRSCGDRCAYSVLRACGYLDLGFWGPHTIVEQPAAVGDPVLYRGSRWTVIAASGGMITVRRKHETQRVSIAEVLVAAVMDSPVATFRLRHRYIARLLAVLASPFCALMLSPAGVRRTIRAGGCDSWVRAVCSGLVNLVASVGMCFVLVYAVFMFTFECGLRLMGCALGGAVAVFIMGGVAAAAVMERVLRPVLVAGAAFACAAAVTGAAIGKVMALAFRFFVAGLGIFLGLIVFAFAVMLELMGVFVVPMLSLFGAFGGVVMVAFSFMLGILYGTPFIGAIMQAVVMCFTCGGVEADFQSWGCTPMGQYARTFTRPFRTCLQHIGPCTLEVVKGAAQLEFTRKAARNVWDCATSSWEGAAACTRDCCQPRDTYQRTREWPSAVWTMPYCIPFVLENVLDVSRRCCGWPMTLCCGSSRQPLSADSHWPPALLCFFLAERTGILKNILCLQLGCLVKVCQPSRLLPDAGCRWLIHNRGPVRPSGGLLLVINRTSHYSNMVRPAPSAPPEDGPPPPPDGDGDVIGQHEEPSAPLPPGVYPTPSAPPEYMLYIPAPSAPPMPDDADAEEPVPCAPAPPPPFRVAGQRAHDILVEPPAPSAPPPPPIYEGTPSVPPLIGGSMVGSMLGPLGTTPPRRSATPPHRSATPPHRSATPPRSLTPARSDSSFVPPVL